jgi:hypothetical protein
VTANELREEINIEIELIEGILREISSLCKDIADREPTTREKTAAAAFLAQFYGGIENILKRISKFYSIPLPTSDTWHMDLFKWFCAPSCTPLPELFDESLSSALAPFRRFRHVVYHSYGFQLEWERMKEGVANIENVWVRFKANLFSYLKNLEPV